MLDTKALAATLLETVQKWIEPALKTLGGRLAALEQQVKSIPAGPKGDPGESIKGEKGDPGERGERGESVQGERGEKGDQGEPGRDGKSVSLDDVAPLLESMHAKWALEWERRAQDALSKALDSIPAPRDGRDGKDGRDGLGFDDVQVEHDGERTVTIRLVKGEMSVERAFRMPVVIDRGVFVERAYEAGDGVTWNGSFWIAQKDAPVGKPGEPESEGWRLAVKKGRDGKDGRNGIDKTAPVKL
ncbi:collagen-like protein [Variovorax soli]|uniref:collagen-like protein n=1 Tax=Variovorax soli TaxID=376815 RepID=UPI00083800FB|nr:collagen-like protein [Variovorax soli]